MVRSLRAIGVVLAVALMAGAASSAHASPDSPRHLRRAARVKVSHDPTPEPVAGEVAVRFRRGASTSGVAIPGTEFRRVKTDGSPTKAKARLEADPDVAEVAPIYVRRATAVPNDELWPMQRDGVFRQQHLNEAWSASTGVGVTIAIIDSGVDANHPDLAGRVLPGYDFVNNDTNASDDFGHGTAVAGIAAAKANNSIGIAGVAYNARILPVKVLDATGSGNDPVIAQGIVWATDHGAKVINMSLGGYGDSPVLAQAVAYALAHNVVVVAATGNDATNTPSYPASSPGVIGVGATDLTGRLVQFSNYGDQVDVAAPGWDMVFPYYLSQGYGQGSGTSFAAPVVSGVAALVRSLSPSMNQATVAARLKDTATDAGPDGDDQWYGNGLVNAWAALGGPVLDPATEVKDAGEAGDRPDTAIPVGSGPTPRIYPEGDEDWYTLDVPAAGTIVVSVQVNGNADDPQAMDAVLEAYGPDLQIFAAVDDEWTPATGESFSGSVGGPGRIYIRVRNWLPSASTAGYSIGANFYAQPGPVNPLPPEPIPPLVVRGTAPDNNTIGAAGVSPTVRFLSSVAPASLSGAATLTRLDLGTTVASTATLSAPDTVTVDPTTPALKSGPYEVRIAGLTTTSGTPIPPVTTRFTVPTVGPYAPFGSASDWVARSYIDLLTQPGDPAMVSWLASTATSMNWPPDMIVDSFFKTPEFTKVIAPLTRLFLAYFNRAPDYPGLKAWVVNMHSGWTLADVSQSFARSSEFTSRYGTLSNAAFVDLVFRNVLGRGPDAAGFTNWLAMLDSGCVTRGGLMLGFSESAEFLKASAARVDVSMAYVGMLRRAPSAVEQSGWVAGRMYRTRQSLVADVIYSAAYRARFGA